MPVQHARIWTFTAITLALNVPNVALAARPTASYLTDRVLVTATLRQPDQLVKELQSTLQRHKFGESDLKRALDLNTELMAGKMMLMGIAASAELDLWSAIGTMLGQELVVGICPLDNQRGPGIIMAVKARHADQLDTLLSAIMTVTGVQIGTEPNAEKSKNVNGVTVYMPKKQLFHCRTDDILLIANHASLMESALSDSIAGTNLASQKFYRAARQRVPADAIAWVAADIAQIRKLSGADATGSPRPINNPLGGLLFGGWWHSIQNANNAVAWVERNQGQLDLEGYVKSEVALPETHRGFAIEQATASEYHFESLPGFLSEVAVQRDWAALFSERESILSLNASSDLVNFSNTLSTMMGQLDFIEDVLSNVAGTARLIMSRQNFNPLTATPTPQLPGFALIVPMKASSMKSLKMRLQSGAQIALSFLSIDAAQKGQPALLMDFEDYKGHRIISGKYPALPNSTTADPATEQPQQKSHLPFRYNFTPCSTIIDNHFIVSTDLHLAKRLVDHMTSQKMVTHRRPAQDHIRLNIPEVCDVLSDNFEELVVNRMLEEAISRPRAEQDMRAFISILRFLSQVTLSTTRSERGYNAKATIRLRQAISQSMR